jgi:predicted CXXCH cytochrome family protein
LKLRKGSYKELEMFSKKLAGLVAVAGLFTAGSAFAAITNSAHDFRADTWYSADTEICKACHAPHGNTAHADGDPLWNHTKTTATNFSMYSGLSIQGTIDSAPSGVSKLCLSCHDGTVSLDSYGGGSADATKMTGLALVGTDLSDDHPISITYTDPGLADKAATDSGLGGKIEDDLLFETGTKVECGSCHDVHNAYTQDKLLVMSNANSQLCQTCHAK